MRPGTDWLAMASMPVTRAFRPASGTAAPSRSDAQLTVVSYNILAQKYIDTGYHGEDAWLSWNYRRPRILAELDSYAADVICLQEVEEPTWEKEILPHFREQGFEGLYYARQSRQNEAVPGPPEGCALLARSERLTLLARKCFRFADHVADLGVGEGEFLSAVAAREDGAVMAVAEETASQRRMLLACTHLYWNPHFPDVKVAQASLLVKQLQRFGAEHGLPGAHPLVLGGDFNSLARKWKSDTFDEVPEGETITSGAYELLSTGKLPVTSGDHPSRRRKDSATEAMLDTGLPLTSAYAACQRREPPVTNNTAIFRGALDYIWFAGADDFSVSSVLEMPYANSALRPEDVQLAPIPDEHFPSDHLAIAARLQLPTRTGTATL